MPDVTYVVVTYRSADDITSCLDAIGRDRGDRARRVVVVDNASDDTSGAIAGDHPVAPTVIIRSRNDGFGTACNVGAAAAEASAIFFINPDATIDAGVGDLLLRALGTDERLAAIGPAIVDPAGDYVARSAGAEPSVRSAIGHFLLIGRVPGLRRLFPPMQLPPTAAARDVDWVSGAAMLVRASAFEAVGGFDERLFLYMEDVDLCRRLRSAGWRIRYEPSATVTHRMGASQGPEAVDLWYRAFSRYVHERHGRLAGSVADAAAFIGMAGRALVYGRLPGRRAQASRMRRAARAAGSALARR